MTCGVITMQGLGNTGRFGNALFEYLFLRTYAKRYDLELQVPKWVGTYLYGFDDPEPSVRLPPFAERWIDPQDAMCQKFPPEGDEAANHDFQGYAQYHTGYYLPDKEFIQGLFAKPAPKHEERLRPAIEKLRRMGGTVIGLHIRRGDYGRKVYHVTPVEWYQAWLMENWFRFYDPVLFICSEEPEMKQHFAHWKPVNAQDLGVTLSPEPYPYYNYLDLDLQLREPGQMDFFPDYALLNSCDVIVGANSTWSFCAAMLNPKLKEYWRSSLPHRGLIRLDPWDSEPLALEQSEDFNAEVPGARLPDNPYWH